MNNAKNVTIDQTVVVKKKKKKTVTQRVPVEGNQENVEEDLDDFKSVDEVNKEGCLKSNKRSCGKNLH